MNVDININKTLRILYVEDDETIRKIFHDIFSTFFAKVEVAIDGQDGFEKYSQGDYDLIISDINMPRLSGIEMAKKIREKDIKTSIVFISAFDQPKYLLETSKLNISGFLIKPFNVKDLLPILHNIHIKNEL